jgi:hypothetical protein
MQFLKKVFDDINVGILTAQAGGSFSNKRQSQGVAMMTAGMTLLGVLPNSAFAQSSGNLNDGINKAMSFGNLLLKAIALFMAIAGVCVFIAGINWAVKKSRPEFATQITTGQIIGGLIGGPCLGIVGVLFNQVINTFFGGSQIGSTVTIPTGN